MIDEPTSIILGVASRSAGVCTRAELITAGVAPRTISGRVGGGVLTRVAPGLFLVPALATLDTPVFLASRANPRGVISHLSAARLWGFAVPPPEEADPVDVSVHRLAANRRPWPGVRIHRVRRLGPDDVETYRPGRDLGAGGVAPADVLVTGRARTVVDLGGHPLVSDRRLRHLLQEAVVAREVTLAEVGASLDRAGGRGLPGRARLRRLLGELDDGEPVAESELERCLAALLDDSFRRQYRPPWHDGRRGVVDFAAPDAHLIVEADGRRWHATTQVMTDDRRRDRLAAANGWLVLRVTWDDMVERPEATATEIATIAAARRGRTAAA